MKFDELGAALGLEEEEYRELIELFMTSGLAELERLRSALAAGDQDQVRRCAHTIKGAAGNLGLNAFHETAKQIENQSADHHTAGLPQAVERLAAQFDALGKLCVPS